METDVLLIYAHIVIEKTVKSLPGDPRSSQVPQDSSGLCWRPDAGRDRGAPCQGGRSGGERSAPGGAIGHEDGDGGRSSGGRHRHEHRHRGAHEVGGR